MMGVLLIRLAGPMQSWGTQSRFTNRDTGREPSKSGVVGLLCAAKGIKRDNLSRIAELASLKMGVRVDREGTIARDFQSAGGGTWPGRKKYGVRKATGNTGATVISDRYYLADADFLVALEGDMKLLKELYKALSDPVWPLYLGRKGYVPGYPIWIPDGLRDGDLVSALKTYPRCRIKRGDEDNRLRLVLECAPEEGMPRPDLPVSFERLSRSFRVRYVKYEWVPTGDFPVMEGDACIFQG